MPVVVNDPRGTWVRSAPRFSSDKKAYWRWWMRQEFALAARWAARAEPMSYATAVAMAHGTEFIPRDILMMAMMGRYYQVVLPDGRILENGRVATSNVQYILDLLDPNIGAVIVRRSDGWWAIDPGSEGQVLTIAGSEPAWRNATGGGGGSVDLFNPPLASSFTLSNPAGTSPAPTLVDDSRLGMVLTSSPTSANDKLQSALMAAPAAPWSLVVRLRVGVWFDNYRNAGLCLTDGTKYTCFLTGEQLGRLSVARYSAYNTWNSNPFQKLAGLPATDFYMRIQNDGTNYSFAISYDAKNWIVVYSEAVAAWLGTSVSFGPVLDPNRAAGLAAGDHVSVDVMYWEVT